MADRTRRTPSLPATVLASRARAVHRALGGPAGVDACPVCGSPHPRRAQGR